MESLSLPIQIGLFILAAIAVWKSGYYLSKATDVLSERFGLGHALGGMVMLAIVTDLPEIAIIGNAVIHGRMGVAIGNILGGVAIQTVVLVAIDAFGLGRKASLSRRITSLEPVLSGILVIALLAISIIGHEMPSSWIFLGVTPITFLIAVTWLAGLYLLYQAREVLPWEVKKSDKDKPEKKKNSGKNEGIGRNLFTFAVTAVVTLVGGVVLESTGDVLAKQVGMSGPFFGATVLAAASAIPEISTGIAAAKEGNYELAVTDIFGGNAFLPVLFLEATLLSGKAVLPDAQRSDIYLACLGIVLTTVYIYGLIFRHKQQIQSMGLDSVVVLILYIIGMVGLFFIK